MKSEKSRKSVGISIMREEETESRKSVAISIMSEENHQDSPENDVNDIDKSRKSIALSVNPGKIIDEQNKAIEEEKQKQIKNESKRSIAISAYPEKAVREKSRKSIAISAYPEKAIIEESRKSIALSWNPDNVPVYGLRKAGEIFSNKDIYNEENKYSPDSANMQRSVSSDHEQKESMIKSRKSIGLSISANENHLKERAMSESKGYEVNDNYQITFKPFKPFKAKRSIALSVITHTPTQKSSRHSVGLSAISHTPTEKYEKESVALSALHLSQQNKDENASFRSVALSAVKVIESKIPGHFDQSEKEETKQPSSNKYISKSSNTREINQPSNYESSRKITSKVSIKQDYSCQVVHGRDKEESHSSLKIDRDAALDPYLRDRSVDAYKRNNATQFRLSQKTVSEETKNLNKQLQVSDDLWDDEWIESQLLMIISVFNIRIYYKCLTFLFNLQHSQNSLDSI